MVIPGIRVEDSPVARFRENSPLAPAPQPGLRLLVTLPALNEDATIREVIARIPSRIDGIEEVDVLVVDDGSTDQTAELARQAGAALIQHNASLGVGAAFHSALSYGLEHAADLIVFIDSDGQFNPADVPTLIAPVVAGDADFATASRFKDPALVPDMPAVKIWGNRMMSRLISMLVGQKFYDVSCGMRCYNRRASRQLHLLAKFTYTQEVFLNLASKNLRIVEVPIRVRGEREFGSSRVAGSLWRYGFRTAQIIFRCYRDFYPLRFFGGLAALAMVPAVGLALFLLSHFIDTGQLTPHKWAGFAAMGLVGFAALVLHVGIIGDMMTRHRVYLEEILYRQRSGDHS